MSNKKSLTTFLLHHILRLGLALIFLAAGAIKLGNISEFAVVLGDFGLVPDPFVVLSAWLVALAELFTGLGLALNGRGSLFAAVGLLVVFIGVLTYGIRLGLDIECGCFGPAYHVDLRSQLFVDFGLVFLCGIAFGSQKQCQIGTVN